MPKDIYERTGNITSYHVPYHPEPVNGVIRVPGSKSMTNRVLLIAAESDGISEVNGIQLGDDALHFISCLKDLGFEILREKVYKKGTKLFPNMGTLYNDYGELLVEKKSGDPLSLWEKGIELDPNYSGNYYHASKSYAEKNNHILALLYAEQFINLESFTARTAEIKNLLLDQYKKIFTSDEASLTKKANTFSKEVLCIIDGLSVSSEKIVINADE